jgi:hypothetical protein
MRTFRSFSTRLLGAALPALMLALLATSSVQAASPVLPIDGDDTHLGVATCAGSTCHGAPQPFDTSPVLQNEFVTWHREDKHSQAYKVLLNDQSKTIAKNLGLESAHTAKQCLVCHTDYVEESKRGKRYQLSDGVGCEACHGGAKRWLGLHVTGEASHADNIKSGLYPTEDPQARATLCLSCHLGTSGDRQITHRIMGAGHPRLSFELDTFTQIEPAHYVIDDDYRKRKTVASAAQTWAIGQLTAADSFLGMVEKNKHQGIFPELVFFDCQSCHHPMSYSEVAKHPGRGWAPRTTAGVGPGVVRLNDSSLLMVSAIAYGVSRNLGAQMQKGIRATHEATTQGWQATRKASASLRGVIANVKSELGESLRTDKITVMLTAVMRDGANGQYRDYAAAEQGYLALDSLFSTLESENALSDRQSASVREAMDRMYLSLRTHEKGFRPSKDGYRPAEDDKDVYLPSRYTAAMQQLTTLFRGS